MTLRIYAWHFRDEGYGIISRKLISMKKKFLRESPRGTDPFPVPTSAEFKYAKDQFAFFQLKEDLGKFVTGSILALDVKDFADENALDKAQLVFVPTEKRFAEWVMTTKNHMLISVIDDIVSKVLKVDVDAKGQWQLSEIRWGMRA